MPGTSGWSFQLKRGGSRLLVEAVIIPVSLVDRDGGCILGIFFRPPVLCFPWEIADMFGLFLG